RRLTRELDGRMADSSQPVRFRFKTTPFRRAQAQAISQWTADALHRLIPVCRGVRWSGRTFRGSRIDPFKPPGASDSPEPRQPRQNHASRAVRGVRDSRMELARLSEPSDGSEWDWSGRLRLLPIQNGLAQLSLGFC